jgi:hypothetical protein
MGKSDKTMKEIKGGRNFLRNFNRILARALIVASLLFCATSGLAQINPGGGSGVPLYKPLDSWSFYDHTNWTSDNGYAPISFTNLNYSYLGDGASLVVDTNVPAWLQFNVVENDGATNLTVGQGSVTFWFAPNWSGTNQGGNGPGENGRLLEAGRYTPDSSLGWWSIYVDTGGNNLHFSTQTNDLSSNVWTWVSAPISWTTNYFHFVALTYSATNTALYLDGVLATNGPPLTVYPGPNALTNGFFMGSDSTGVLQAHGLFNNLYTYSVPLDAGTIQATFTEDYEWYMMNPYNSAMNISSAYSIPSTTTPDVITGPGNLQLVGSATPINGTNAYDIWIANVTATTAGNGTMDITFTIQGGSNGIPYDVFANSVLGFGNNNVSWAWEGQGYQGGIYTITNMPNAAVFIILGTPQDSDDNGLTDAYELLVSHTNPYLDDQDGAGISDGWQVLLGLNPLVNQVAQPGTRANYVYTPADWLDQISGIKSGSVTSDAEGNVLQVSQ